MNIIDEVNIRGETVTYLRRNNIKTRGETVTSSILTILSQASQVCRRIGFHLNCHLPHMNAEAKICTKRFMGPGETRRIRHKRDVNYGLMKNINGTKVSYAKK